MGPSTSYMNCAQAPMQSGFLGQRVAAVSGSGTTRRTSPGGLSVRALNKKEFIDKVAGITKFNKYDTKTVVDTVFDAIIETVAEGDKVQIPGFGVFEPRIRKERKGRNPRTGEALIIPEARIPHFTVGQYFKNEVNGITIPKHLREGPSDGAAE
ncbi:hypothetical protein KFL_000100220 [Klebsormidium nitens]|uniref:Uncharacterized protein n=2 Tax=Klebsormidium TaxID=3174 RepID=A0A1Y1HNS3_KLENI|nr:hypothetical protein KFL_000100220 [Klebsormidium nitens]|eukprot:GAQ78256.1 hypothetical protein KFL_000100220 [Klebsormidium nitens]